MEIIKMVPNHWQAVREIYLQGIATRNATLENDAPSWDEWDKGHLAVLRYTAVVDGNVAGWAALTPFSGRCVYAGVAEVSVYVHEDHRGKQIGAGLLQQLIKESEAENIWTLQSGIFPENKVSLALHKKYGFRTIGFREKIGRLDGIWRDVVLMERRSKIIGQD